MPCTGSTSSKGEMLITDFASGETRVTAYPEMVGAVAPRVGGGVVAAVTSGFVGLDADGVMDRRADILPEGIRMNDAKTDPAGRFWAGQLRDGLRGGSRRPVATRRELGGDARPFEPDSAERPRMEPRRQGLLPRRVPGPPDPPVRLRSGVGHSHVVRVGPGRRRCVPPRPSRRSRRRHPGPPLGRRVRGLGRPRVLA